MIDQVPQCCLNFVAKLYPVISYATSDNIFGRSGVVCVSFAHEHFIERFDTATGLNLDRPGGPGHGTGFYVTSISNPTGLALGRNGNLYAAGLANGVIDQILLLGAISQFASGIANPLGLAFDSGGNLYVVGGQS